MDTSFDGQSKQHALMTREKRVVRQSLQHVVAEENHPAVRDVLAYIVDHLYDSDLTVSRVLEACSIRSNSFTHLFKYHQRRSMREWIEVARLRTARRMLGHETIEITNIAFAIGYNDYRSFARAFKRHMDCSASEYRAEQQ